jgi:CheY-like chemotaxis protein
MCSDSTMMKFVACSLTLPRMKGWETLEALRKLAPDIPVILASGYGKARVMASDHPEWPQAFLGKPYRMADLKAAREIGIREFALKPLNMRDIAELIRKILTARET